MHNGQNHLFHGGTSVLEGVFVLILVFMVVRGVYEIVVFQGKQVIHSELGAGQPVGGGILDQDGTVTISLQVFAVFVAQTGTGVAVTDNLGVTKRPNGAMIGSDDNIHIFRGQCFSEFAADASA